MFNVGALCIYVSCCAIRMAMRDQVRSIRKLSWLRITTEVHKACTLPPSPCFKVQTDLLLSPYLAEEARGTGVRGLQQRQSVCVQLGVQQLQHCRVSIQHGLQVRPAEPELQWAYLGGEVGGRAIAVLPGAACVPATCILHRQGLLPHHCTALSWSLTRPHAQVQPELQRHLHWPG